MYHYADRRGLVARGPGVRTWRDMRLQLETAGPVAREFAEHGHTGTPLALAEELQAAEAGTPLARLRQAALDADDMLVLTDGVGVEQQHMERRR